MPNTAVKVTATPNHLVYLLTGSGDVIGPTLTSASLLADMVDGPLKTLWGTALANQAAMRTALLGMGSGCRCFTQMVVAVNDVTGQVNQVVVDVDAVTPTLAEINIGMSDTTGQLAYLHIEYVHTVVR